MDEVKFLGLRHAALKTTDLTRAIDFYVKHLGFEEDQAGHADWAMVRSSGTTLSLLKVASRSPGSEPKASHPSHLGVCVSSKTDVDSLHRRFIGLRLPDVGAPEEHRDGSYGFYLKDPDGNQLECIFIPSTKG